MTGPDSWAANLADSAARRFTGEWTLQQGARRHVLAFERGLVVNASSPAPADTALRIAIAIDLISARQSAEVTRLRAENPRRDELALILNATQMTPENVGLLRREITCRRAARTFSIEHGDILVSSSATLASTLFPVAVPAIVHVGARAYLSEDRMAAFVRAAGSRYILVGAEVEPYAFSDEERDIVDVLRTPSSLTDLETRHPHVDCRRLLAIVYALLTCGGAIADKTRRLATGSGELIPPVVEVTAVEAVPTAVDPVESEGPAPSPKPAT